jgi:hypothetical protein
MSTWADEVAYHEQKADQLRRDQLGTVQAAARRWSALMGALLGVFGTVAFAGGLTTLDRLAPPYDVLVRVLTTLALLGAAGAVALLARAAGGLRMRDVPLLTGAVLLERQDEWLAGAVRSLTWGRRCALGAAGLVLGGSLLVLWTPAPPAASPLLVRFPGAALCGRPVAGTDGRLTIAGRPLDEAVDVVPVAACPLREGERRR